MQDMRTRLESSELIKNWTNHYPTLSVINTEMITPDASLRRYYRINYVDTTQGEEIRTVVGMIFDSVAPAEADGGLVVASDEAFTQIAEFLPVSIGCPKILFSDKVNHAYIIEDLGSNVLADLACEWSKLKGMHDNCVRSEMRSKIIFLYEEAIKKIQNLREVKPSSEIGFLPFSRKFSEGLLLKEMSEFIDFAIGGLGKNEKQRIFECMQCLSERIANFPYVLIHRDFHSWNLHVVNNSIRVIDFQDALMGPDLYDLVSLVNDRDIDMLLGEDVIQDLLNYARELFNVGDIFFEQFACISLQRDLKVAGRFCKLAEQRGALRYLEWVPGTKRRIGKVLSYLSATMPQYKEINALASLLISVDDDVKEGAKGMYIC